ncbi:MAG TPA: RNA-directed DNA polymerase [Steroidobacteraceae bacterium]
MTIYASFLSRGYFPKELPPAFYTEGFSHFARTAAGRAALTSYKPTDSFTDCVSYRLAQPSLDGLATRPLRIPHPFAYAKLAGIVAKNFRRLLTKVGASPFSKSRPVYGTDLDRALRTLIHPSRLSRERALSRAGATHLLKADISQFYPSLYTHAVGWAVDPKLRERKHWNNRKLLGKQLDQALMDLQGKVSQGLPIGPDLSFLLAEAVLGQVDRSLKLPKGMTYRWFDDYEIACTSRQAAEQTLARLAKLLDTYKLRLNPEKTKILELPMTAGDAWQDELLSLSKHSLSTPAGVVAYFDHALRLKVTYPASPVLMYAVGVLFRLLKPPRAVHRVAQSYILQAIVSEPGCAQKVFALLTFWEINGAPFDRDLAAQTIENLARLHQSRGLSSDLAWALSFAILHGLTLTKPVGIVTSQFDDDAIAIEALDANARGLLPGFDLRRLERALTNEGCEGTHWLVLYEGVRQGFLKTLEKTVRSDKLFEAMLAAKVAFYRQDLPPYAPLIHPGGAPEWVVRAWLKGLSREARASRPDAVTADIAKLSNRKKLSADDILHALLLRYSVLPTGAIEPYGPS